MVHLTSVHAFLRTQQAKNLDAKNLHVPGVHPQHYTKNSAKTSNFLSDKYISVMLIYAVF